MYRGAVCFLSVQVVLFFLLCALLELHAGGGVNGGRPAHVDRGEESPAVQTAAMKIHPLFLLMGDSLMRLRVLQRMEFLLGSGGGRRFFALAWSLTVEKTVPRGLFAISFCWGSSLLNFRAAVLWCDVPRLF